MEIESALSSMGVPSAQIEVFAPLIAAHVNDMGTYELACFLGNAAHESSKFVTLEENLNYGAQGLANTWGRCSTTLKRGGPPTDKAKKIARNPRKIASFVYADRLGNGSELSEDGWTYRGRGLFQVTFTNNYAACGEFLGLDLISEPELLTEPEHALNSALWFWKANNCDKLTGDLEALTKRINGGYNGLADRKNLISAAHDALEN